MKEFRHKCAICGQHNPQIHHLDENPSNNDPSNLLPLCPNCHLQDAHDPTSPPDPQKLRLFRSYKDPLILDPRFHPIFRRMTSALNSNLLLSPRDLNRHATEFLDFIEQFQMGGFYRGRILAEFRLCTGKLNEIRKAGLEAQEGGISHSQGLAIYLRNSVESLTVEMLRYQGWATDRNR